MTKSPRVTVHCISAEALRVYAVQVPCIPVSAAVLFGNGKQNKRKKGQGMFSELVNQVPPAQRPKSVSPRVLPEIPSLSPYPRTTEVETVV